MTLQQLAEEHKRAAKDLYISLICGKKDGQTYIQINELRKVLFEIEHILSMEDLGIRSDLVGLAARECL